MTLAKLTPVLIVAILVAGCKGPDLGAPVTNGNDAPAAASRAAERLEDALIGHWKAGSTHLYFSPDKLIRIETGSAPEILHYSIEAKDESSGVLLTRMSVPTGWHWNEMTFSPDRRTFSPKVWLEGDRFKTPSRSALYIDDAQQP